MEGRFRADLFFRINVMQIHLPPLKDRGNDVQELATLFMASSRSNSACRRCDRRLGGRRAREL